jgi:hypothetical protein
MLTDEQKNKFSSLRVEIIDINILAHFFVRKLNRFGYLFQKSTRHHIFEEFVSLRYMENGLILHLTNLDDDSSNFSFRSVSKEIKKSPQDQNQVRRFNDLLKTYRQDINKLKTAHRILRIAHLNYDEDLPLDKFLNFDKELYPLINSANLIGDFVWGTKINCRFNLGSYEKSLDFRNLTENLKVNFSEEKGF